MGLGSRNRKEELQSVVKTQFSLLAVHVYRCTLETVSQKCVMYQLEESGVHFFG